MCYIRVNKKYDFEELVNVLLKNGYKVTVEASMLDDDGNGTEDEVSFYIVEFEYTKDMKL